MIVSFLASNAVNAPAWEDMKGKGMEIEDTYVLPVERSKVWVMLNDPEVLRECIPGCEKLELVAENNMEATVALKVGPVSARFAGAVQLIELVEPSRFSIVGEGKGGIAGYAKGRADVFLLEHPEGTQLTYKANVAIGGKLAQLGGRLLVSTSKKLSGQFFDRFVQKVHDAGEQDGEQGAA